MRLAVKLEADASDALELGFEEVDVSFFVGHEVLEEIPGGVISSGTAVLRGFLIEGAGFVLGREVALENLLDVLADAELFERLPKVEITLARE